MRSKRVSLLMLTGIAGLVIWVGCETAKSSNPSPSPTVSVATTNSSATLKPGPNDPRIAYVTAMLLGQYHYLQRPLDTELSEKFFNGYINTLDPRHENFLQTDLSEFNVYRTNLDHLTIRSGGTADLTPAFAIYGRFIQRQQQHSDYVNELLKQDKFKFNTDERIEMDRRHEPFPKDLDEAKALWKQRLRYDYLNEKLAEETTETNGTIVVDSSKATNVVQTLSRHYRWSLHVLTGFDSDNVLQIYLEALAHAYDPHSDYFSAPSAQDFSIDMSLSLFGIGAQLTEDDGYCTIKELVSGGPAEKSKQLNPQDRIIAVAQGSKPPVDVVDMDLSKVVQMIRGPKNTEVRLTISPFDDRPARRVVVLTRDEIKLEDKEAKAQLIVEPDGKRLGVINLPSFYASVPLPGNEDVAPKYTSADVAKLIKRLKREKVDGIILDLRSNPGGSLEEAVKFTGLFIKDGPVVLARNAEGQVGVDSDPDPDILYGGPLVVMINRFSASASEIAAAALQDYGRAIIVGDSSTFGKGTVQSLDSLRPFVWPATPSATNDPGTIKITKGKFYRVTGASTQFKGVASDIVLPDVLDHYPYAGEKSLDNPLPWDTIQPVEFDKLNLVQPYLDILRQNSAARIATNQDFIYIQQDIAEYEKNQSDKSVPLNEHQVIAERQKVALERQKRDKELNARAAPTAKIYDLTLENSSRPNLPAPTSYFYTNNLSAINTTNAIPLQDFFGKAIQSNNLSVVNATNAVPAAPELKRVAPDAILDESARILEDYISLLSKKSVQIANQ